MKFIAKTKKVSKHSNSCDPQMRVGIIIVASWRHMTTKTQVNIGLHNGFLPDSTKPLPEPMLIYHQ